MKKKFLILRFSSIGDIILTTPVFRCLKKQFPECEIHFLTKAKFKDLLIENTNIDKIISLDKNISKTIGSLKENNYDYIIDLHNNLRTKIIKTFLFKKSFSIDKLNFKKWLIVNFKINILPNKHIVDRYLETLKEFNIKNDELGLDFYISQNTNIEKFNLNGEYIVYAIGGQHQTKKLSFNKQIELIPKIEKQIVLLGGKEDEENATKLTEKFKNIINLCGKTSINESALIILNSDKVITHDTGMMHISAALNKNIDVIWGNTIPEFGMYPYLPKNTKSKYRNFEVKNLKCRPCSKIGFNECPKKHFNCMNLISFNDINKI